MNPIAKYIESFFIGKKAQKLEYTYKDAEKALAFVNKAMNQYGLTYEELDEAVLYYQLAKISTYFKQYKDKIQTLVDAVR